MSSLVEDVLTPGQVAPVVIKIINAAIVGLLATIAALAWFGALDSVHIYVLLFLAVGLLGSINWWVRARVLLESSRVLTDAVPVRCVQVFQRATEAAAAGPECGGRADLRQENRLARLLGGDTPATAPVAGRGLARI